METDTSSSTAPSARDAAVERRIAAVVGDETVVYWARAWVSRDGRMHAFAARTPDFVVVTERSLYLVSTGFFTRLPRRAVYVEFRSRVVTVSQEHRAGRGYRLAITTAERKPLLFEMRRNARTAAVVHALLDTAPEAAGL